MGLAVWTPWFPGNAANHVGSVFGCDRLNVPHTSTNQSLDGGSKERMVIRLLLGVMRVRA